MVHGRRSGQAAELRARPQAAAEDAGCRTHDRSTWFATPGPAPARRGRATTTSGRCRSVVTQARAIAKSLAGDDVTRIVSSPFVRCSRDGRAAGPAHRRRARALRRTGRGRAARRRRCDWSRRSPARTRCCARHGDVVGNLLNHFASVGVPLDDDRLEKASMWVLDVVDGEVLAARYVAPPGG